MAPYTSSQPGPVPVVVVSRSTTIVSEKRVRTAHAGRHRSPLCSKYSHSPIRAREAKGEKRRRGTYAPHVCYQTCRGRPTRVMLRTRLGCDDARCKTWLHIYPHARYALLWNERECVSFIKSVRIGSVRSVGSSLPVCLDLLGGTRKSYKEELGGNARDVERERSRPSRSRVGSGEHAEISHGRNGVLEDV
jgi:hypothetical protein